MFKNSGPGLKLSLTALLVVVIAIMVFIFAAILAYPLFGINYFQVSRPEFVGEGIMIQKYWQTISSLGVFVFPAIFAALLFEYKPLDFLAINRLPRWFFLILAIAGMYSFLPVIEKIALWNAGIQLPEVFSGIEAWMKRTEAAAMELTIDFMRMDNPIDLWINLFMIALLPALGEELLFRGVIQKYLSQIWKNIHIAVWLTAIIFSLLHFQFYGFIPRMILGAYMGYLLVYSKSIWVPILAHFINNGTAVVYYYYNQAELKTTLAETEIISANAWILILSGISFSILFLILIRKKA